MTNTATLLTIAMITGILITGGITTSPYAYSSGYNNDDDDHHDDCEFEHESHHGYDDSNGHDDNHDEECEPDPCDCDKPDTLTVLYNGPVEFEIDAEGNNVEKPVTIQIFKKGKNVENPEKQLGNDITDVLNGTNVQISSSMFGKDKLNSNTAFRIVNPETNETIDIVEIHTSCSQPLHVGLVKNGDNGIVSLEVLSGERDGKSSIPPSDPLTCEEEQKPIPVARITVKKVITTDNSENIENPITPDDFELTITNVETNDSFPLINGLESEVPAGTYTMSETGPINYSFVLIAGDTKCPSMLDEEFTLKKDKNLSCTIYNDDNFEPTTSGGDGVFFVRNSINIDPESEGTCMINAAMNITNSPCVKLDGSSLFVADPTLEDPLKAPRSIITSTLIQITTEPLSPPECIFLGVTEMNNATGFALDCQGIQADGVSTYNVNYAIIDALG